MRGLAVAIMVALLAVQCATAARSGPRVYLDGRVNEKGVQAEIGLGVTF